MLLGKWLAFAKKIFPKDKGRGHRTVLLESSLKQQALHLRPILHNEYPFDYILVKVGC